MVGVVTTDVHPTKKVPEVPVAGIASGLPNLLPFLGLIASLALPLAAAVLQFKTHRDPY